jgi:hypothetical protein
LPKLPPPPNADLLGAFPILKEDSPILGRAPPLIVYYCVFGGSLLFGGVIMSFLGFLKPSSSELSFCSLGDSDSFIGTVYSIFFLITLKSKAKTESYLFLT